MLVLATSKPKNMSVKWIGPGKIESKISATNYIVNVPGRREKSQIYHVNLLKHYFKRMEKVNIVTHEYHDPDAMQDLEIAFPSADSSSYDFRQVVEETDLGDCCTSEQLRGLEKLLNMYREVFFITLD